MQIGYKLAAEGFGPADLIDQAIKAEEAGFDFRGQFACGPDVARYVEVAQPFVDAGFDHLVMQNAGPDPDGFIEFFARELEPAVRRLVPHRAAA